MVNWVEEERNKIGPRWKHSGEEEEKRRRDGEEKRKKRSNLFCFSKSLFHQTSAGFSVLILTRWTCSKSAALLYGVETSATSKTHSELEAWFFFFLNTAIIHVQINTVLHLTAFSYFLGKCILMRQNPGLDGKKSKWSHLNVSYPSFVSIYYKYVYYI